MASYIDHDSSNVKIPAQRSVPMDPEMKAYQEKCRRDREYEATCGFAGRALVRDTQTGDEFYVAIDNPIPPFQKNLIVKSPLRRTDFCISARIISVNGVER